MFMCKCSTLVKLSSQYPKWTARYHCRKWIKTYSPILLFILNYMRNKILKVFIIILKINLLLINSTFNKNRFGHFLYAVWNYNQILSIE